MIGRILGGVIMSIIVIIVYLLLGIGIGGFYDDFRAPVIGSICILVVVTIGFGWKGDSEYGAELYSYERRLAKWQKRNPDK